MLYSRKPSRILSIASSLIALGASQAFAQITPERSYFGIDRAVPMAVRLPAGADAAAILLLDPDGTEQARVDVTKGRVDLAAMFPQLWQSDEHHLMYAQLEVDGEQFAPPVVLQPMLTPEYAYPMNPGTLEAQIPPRRATPMYQNQIMQELARQQGISVPPQTPVYSGLRTWVDQYVVVDTSMGEMEFRLRPDMAPNTCWNYLLLVRGGFYTDIIFHRVVAKASNGFPFVIQVGDPTGTGSGGPGYFIDLEPTQLKHDFGVLSMARSGEPNSNGSQVFVCLSREGTAFLDGNYTAFAEAVRGGDVIRALAGVPVGPGDRPLDPPVLKSAHLVDAPPRSMAPKALSEEPGGSPEGDATKPAGTKPAGTEADGG